MENEDYITVNYYDWLDMTDESEIAEILEKKGNYENDDQK